jgi:hypothetical protein
MFSARKVTLYASPFDAQNESRYCQPTLNLEHWVLMKRILFIAVAMGFVIVSVGNAAAQQYKWTDRNGKVQYGDVPPAGVKATPMRGPTAAPAPAAPAADAKGGAAKDAGSKGPLTPAEQEAEYRKRQAEAQKGQEKEEKAAQDAQAKRENCANAREQLRVLESGQRYARTDAKGERYYLDDDQRAAETARARKAVGEWCS